MALRWEKSRRWLAATAVACLLGLVGWSMLDDRVDRRDAQILDAWRIVALARMAGPEAGNTGLVEALGALNAAGVDLSEIRLPGGYLHAVDLRGGNLWGADFAAATLYLARFDGANLVRARFAEANLRRAGFRDAVLRRAGLVQARLDAADFAGADLTEADFTGAQGTTSAQLAAAAVLCRTVLPDGTQNDRDCPAG